MNSRKEKSLAYVCAPYCADSIEGIDANINQAVLFAQKVYELGYVPLTPHLLFPFIKKEESEEQREWAVEADLEILKMCDALFVCGEKITNGMEKEIRLANDLDLPINRLTFKE